LKKPINFTELFLRLEKIANMRSLLRSAEDLRQAMDITESTAAETIQNLEVLAGSLQSTVDSIETILTNDELVADDKVVDALDILQAIN